MKRQRGRGRKPVYNSNRAYESSGPDVKIRGSAQHIYEKYQQLARDAAASGDRVVAENYLQHAEHYLRLLMAAQPNPASARERTEGAAGRFGGYEGDRRDEDQGDEGGGGDEIALASEDYRDVDASLGEEQPYVASAPPRERRYDRHQDQSRHDQGRHDQGRHDQQPPREQNRRDNRRRDGGRRDEFAADSGDARTDSVRTDSGRADSGRSESGRSDYPRGGDRNDRRRDDRRGNYPREPSGLERTLGRGGDRVRGEGEPQLFEPPVEAGPESGGDSRGDYRNRRRPRGRYRPGTRGEGADPAGFDGEREASAPEPAEFGADEQA